MASMAQTSAPTVGSKRTFLSRYVGVSWDRNRSAWEVQLWDLQSHRARHVGYFAAEEDAARAYDRAAVQVLGPDAQRNFPSEAIKANVEPPERQRRRSSRYDGVSWDDARSEWRAQLADPTTQSEAHVGFFATEADAARAHDSAAVQAHGSGAKLNFPKSSRPVKLERGAASEPADARKAKSSQYVGVRWNTTSCAWQVRLWDPLTKRQRHIGCYEAEEDAARAYDCAAVQASGPNTKRNFPNEIITAASGTAGGERKQRTKSSHYIGVSWHKARSSWHAKLWDPLAKRRQYIGCYASEDDAARAYDFAAVQAGGLSVKRNFPNLVIGEPPAPLRQ